MAAMKQQLTSFGILALLLWALSLRAAVTGRDLTLAAPAADEGNIALFEKQRRGWHVARETNDDGAEADDERDDFSIDSDPWWQDADSDDDTHMFEKRRGGGGRGGGSGGGRSGGGRSGGSSAGGRTSRSGSKVSSSSSSGPSSNSGGKTIAGSGTPRTFGGGNYYSGGSSVPFTAGAASAAGIVPYLLSASALALIPGLWLLSAVYAYPYHHSLSYYNKTLNTNMSLPVLCLCQQYSVCGCDDNNNSTFTTALYENATALPEDAQTYTSKIAEVNGTRTLIINGTLANGTTASGGTDDGSGAATLGRNWGLVMAALIVMCAVYM